MARRGDALYLLNRTWWLDFIHEGKRHAVRIGKNISRTVAGEIAVTRRGQILKGEVGIGRKRKDLPFEKATEIFLEWKLLEQATERRLRTIIHAGLHAGLRIASEALTLRRQSVSLERGSWGRWGFLAVEAAYAKSGKTRTIPLNSILHDAFADYFKA